MTTTHERVRDLIVTAQAQTLTTLPPRTCAFCGQDTPGSRFCSPDCRDDFERKEGPDGPHP